MVTACLPEILKICGKTKIAESIRGGKRVKKSLSLACDFVKIKIENENKKVLETQFVTTS